MAKYKINRSNYTLKQRHQLTGKGVVFERDFMTTTNLGQWDSGSIPYGESNFRMFYRKVENARKRPNPGTWLKPASGCSDGEYWTAGCVDKTGVTEETSIKLKPNYNSLLDFAYYGSCVELIKSSIKKIVEKFPGEAYVDTKDEFDITENETGHLVRNDFDIDFFDTKKETGIKDFVNNIDKYVIVKGASEFTITDVSVTTGTACEHGEVMAEVDITYGGSHLVIQKRIFENGFVLFTESGLDTHIRPVGDCVDNFFDGLDDFERLLLNRESKPEYTAVLDWPHDTDYGVQVYKRSFTWPKDGDWNIDISSIKYQKYLEDLLSLAQFYDDGYTDNLWRMLTHDSVKSMDLAFSNPSKDEDQEDYNIGATRLEGLLWAYGRQFDDLKRAIDNIKNTTNITYDENSNVPDYFLSDSLELSGWEVYSPDLKLGTDKVTVSWRNGVTKEYTAEEAGYTFLRNLKLNSKEILKKKGTRDGIISLLGLFGMVCKDFVPEDSDEWDFSIDEKVAVVNRSIEGAGSGVSFDLETLNSWKSGADTSTEEMAYNPFFGLPFTYVSNGDERYIIPWFSDNVDYDGGTYFQMKGGWCKKDVLKVLFNDGVSEQEIIFTGPDYTYDETLKYLSVVDKVSDLKNLPAGKVYEGAVCYVEDISDLEEPFENTEDTVYPHYFILQNADNYDKVDYDGWRPAVYPDGRKVVARIEAIIDDFKANNPHVGYGKYDGGQEYLERIKHPFKWHLENDSELNPQFNDIAYECDGTLKEDIRNYHVELEEGVSDNAKTWFFGNVMLTGGSADVLEMGYNVFDFENDSYGTEATEAAANSVINTKVIEFVFRSDFLSDFREYFEAVILPYMKQMIPSTAIWSYSIAAKTVIKATADQTAPNLIGIKADAIVYKNELPNDDVVLNYNPSQDIPM